MKNDIKKKKKLKLSKLFRNNQFLLIISLLISFTMWINVSLSDTNESTATITNIPVQVQLSEEVTNSGLEIFSGSEQYASVTVTGNRVALGNLTSEDIIVTAQNAGTITTTGTYPLSLTARKADSSDNFEISSSISPSVITIYVDHADEEKFDVENKISYSVAEGYHTSVALSTDEITIQGPESEVSKIHSVAIEGSINGELSESREMDCEVKLYDYSGEVYSNNMLTLSSDRIKAVFTVEPKREIPISIQYKNRPQDLVLTGLVTIDPASITIAGPADILDNMESILTEEVDLATLKNEKKTLNLELDIPRKCTNLSDITSTKVTFDFSKMSSQKFNATSFTVENLPDDYVCDVTTASLEVTVIGQDKTIEKLTDSDISCVIDASKVNETTGSITLPVKVNVNNGSCWAYGSYTANVFVSKK